MKTVCEQKTLELAHSELTRFNGYAKLNVDSSLLSFEIRCTSGAVMISGPTAVDVLYGVYDFAERYLGYCFSNPDVTVSTRKISFILCRRECLSRRVLR